MSKVLIDHSSGRIKARFRHAARPWMVVLRIRLFKEVTTSKLGEGWQQRDSVAHHRRSADESMYFWSTACPIRDYLRFLEAVTLQVQECAFEWEAEGPEARFEWARWGGSRSDKGHLTITWDGWFRDHKHTFSHRMLLNTRQMVRNLYAAFRSFVESPEYVPMMYEAVPLHEALLTVVNESSIEGVLQALIDRDAAEAESLIQVMQDAVVGFMFRGQHMRHPLGHFLDQARRPVNLDDPTSWIGRDWDGWDKPHRANFLSNSVLRQTPAMCLDGAESIRHLRSTLIEEWLAHPTREAEARL
jgi:hypothetical protein